MTEEASHSMMNNEKGARSQIGCLGNIQPSDCNEAPQLSEDPPTRSASKGSFPVCELF
jgi:hypothetical protein